MPIYIRGGPSGAGISHALDRDDTPSATLPTTVTRYSQIHHRCGCRWCDGRETIAYHYDRGPADLYTYTGSRPHP